MKAKVVFGIIAPLVVIMLLVVFSSSSIGISITSRTLASVSAGEVISEDYSSYRRVVLKTITVNNDFPLGRRYEIPRLGACLYDTQGVRIGEQLTVQYSDGETSHSGRAPISDLLFRSYPYNSRASVEVGASSEKTIEFGVASRRIYDYDHTDSSQGTFDEILLFELENSERMTYNTCQSLGDERIAGSKRIAIV